MSRPNEPTLTGLPTELRNKILSLVVYHQNDGIICPTPDYNWSDYVALASGERFTILDDGSPFIPDQYFSTISLKIRCLELEKIWKKSTCKRTGHFCKMDCLRQPAISLVNSQLRRESLPIFYGVNHFHLELGNFKLPKSGWDNEVERAPVDWWRGIGDENLCRIRKLTVVGQKDYDERRKEDGLIITYTDEPREVEMKRTCTHPWNGITMYCGENPEAHGMVDAAIRPQLKALEKYGLSVEILDEIAAWLEPPETGYLRREAKLKKAADKTSVLEEVAEETPMIDAVSALKKDTLSEAVTKALLGSWTCCALQ